jgi:hypothetical protein
MSARMVVTMFAVAIIHASFCSAVCGLGVCPYQQLESAGRDFDHCCSFQHPGAHHHDHGPGKSDCSTHHHPTFNVANAGGLVQFQLTSSAQIPISDQPGDVSDARQLSVGSSALFDLGPPIARNSHCLRTFVLRI